MTVGLVVVEIRDLLGGRSLWVWRLGEAKILAGVGAGIVPLSGDGMTVGIMVSSAWFRSLDAALEDGLRALSRLSDGLRKGMP